MTLEKLREKINLENLKMFRDFFLEDDTNIKYVVTSENNEEDFSILSREELLEVIHKLKIEYVDYWQFALGVLNNEPVRIEYF